MCSSSKSPGEPRRRIFSCSKWLVLTRPSLAGSGRPLTLVDVLRRLQDQTLIAGGPFIGMHNNLTRKWYRIIRKTGIKSLTIHDLRRTYITRLIRAKAELSTVQKLAGHASVQTTLKYYNQVSDDDMRAAVAKLR